MVELPESYTAVDNAAVAAQCRTVRVHRAELLLLIVAAAAGISSWRVTSADLDVWAGIGALAFGLTLVSALVRNLSHPQGDWVRARGLAETTKSAAWRYAVRGTPYAGVEADRDFLDHLSAVTDAGRDLRIQPVGGDQITGWMSSTRAGSLDERKKVYRECRLDDQIGFYNRRSHDHDEARKLWFAVGAAANVLGILGGLLRFVGVIEVDLIGVAAAVGGAAVAWTQLHQHRTLAVSYAVTAQQLSIARDLLAHANDDGWAGYVESTEDLMAREHLLWLSHRGSAA